MFPISLLVVGFLLSIDCYTLLCYYKTLLETVYYILVTNVLYVCVCVYFDLHRTSAVHFV